MDIQTAVENYNEYLNEYLNGEWAAPSDVLKALDPIAYRVGFDDWADAEGIDTDELSGNWDLHL